MYQKSRLDEIASKRAESPKYWTLDEDSTLCPTIRQHHDRRSGALGLDASVEPETGHE